MFNEMQLTVFTLLVFACCVVSRKSLKSQCIGKITTQQAKTSKVNTVSCILCILCNMDLLVRSVDTFYKIRITSEKLTSLCFNLYFVSIFPFTNILLVAISPSFLCSLSLFVAITITTVETLWGHPRDMKKVSISGAGHLQEWFSVWELARLQINKDRKCKKPVN